LHWTPKHRETLFSHLSLNLIKLPLKIQFTLSLLHYKAYKGVAFQTYEVDHPPPLLRLFLWVCLCVCVFCVFPLSVHRCQSVGLCCSGCERVRYLSRHARLVTHAPLLRLTAAVTCPDREGQRTGSRIAELGRTTAFAARISPTTTGIQASFI
jgi:hypothetical protein